MPSYILGKQPAAVDDRNLRFAPLMVSGLKIPDAYNVDAQFNPKPTLPVFANDHYGDCVMAARAHQTLRFEKKETGQFPSISDSDVTKEYFRESGNRDSGLVILDSIKLWRSRGWTAGGKLLKIDAFSQVNYSNRDEVKAAIFASLGGIVGVQLPAAAQTQIGHRWTANAPGNTRPGSWGGHCMYVNAYDSTGVQFVTWGRYQWADWAWFDKYCDEFYVTFDALDSASSDVVQVAAVKQFVQQIDGERLA